MECFVITIVWVEIMAVGSICGVLGLHISEEPDFYKKGEPMLKYYDRSKR